MCLYIKDPTPRIAKRDITCYKLLYVDDNGEYHPYFKLSYDIKFNTVLNNDVPLKAFLLDEPEKDALYTAVGIFHTFSRKRLRYLNKTAKYDWILCKAIIPKGSFYYKGHTICFSDKGETAYGSNKIIYLPKFYK